MIHPLTSLRFFFAFMVFFSHINFLFRSFDNSVYNYIYSLVDIREGHLGVSFFFILSGFVLAYAYKEKILSNKISYINFIKARIFRIYPLHFMTLLFAIIISIVYVDNWFTYLQKIFSNLFLLQSFIPSEEYYFSFNGVAWSISNEMFFYVLFPIIIKFSNKVNLLIVVLTLICPFILKIDNEHWFYYINPLFRLSDFILGILLFSLHCKIKSKKLSFINKNCTIFEIVALLIFVLFFYFHSAIPELFRWSIYYWTPMLLIIFIFSFQTGKISKMLSYNFFVYLGKISFAFYMVHQLVIKFLWMITNKINIPISGWILIAIAFILSLLISHFTYKYFEKPLNYFLRQKLITD